ncbi:MAG: hypothetical protein ACD_3C00194G0006 [uncultured bacterium (gcode 4)]|uniref:Phosphoglycerate mutase n=1 Tax=uncultured bacterium (gcode 4) TaxID=1234023 RepID=K2F8S5_9BACT|nr:MAG: hypothetical protein ACD_3C00194G0006 [uncultured bacterium (gcode 4)]
MKTIYFVRHAETEMNVAANLIWGQSPHAALTEKGIWQAEKLWEYLRKSWMEFDDIYSSDVVRTRHTARIVWKHLGFTEDDLKIRSELMEISQWDWEWLSRELIYTPETISMIHADNHNFKAPNGESQKDVEIRVHKLMDELLSEENPAETILIFTHWFTIRCFLRGILDSDAKMSFRIAIDNTSITKISFDWDFFSIAKINGTSHLG